MAPRAGDHVVVVSPHLDDAALSCGAALAAWVRAGVDVLVVTVFDGSAVPPLSPLAAGFHAGCGLVGDAMAARRAEDVEACARLGVRRRGLGLRECLYRADGAGDPVYAVEAEIFAGHVDREPAIVERVAEAIAAIVGPADLVLAPLGIGGHVDHVAVRTACERVAGAVPLVHFEDVPYALYERCRGWEAAHAGRPRCLVASAEEDWATKLDAIADYRSQAAVLWIDPAPWRAQVTGYARRLGGGRPAERFWGAAA